MISTQDTLKKSSNYIRKSATLKIFTIGLLVLVLLIPAAMINSLIYERESRKNAVVAEISEKWGSSQTITGPFVTIPYKIIVRDEKEKVTISTGYLHLLPETLDISGDIKPEVRYRSIFEAVLYNVQLNVQGTFRLPPLAQLNIDPANILWDKSFFSIGITDMRGIQNSIIVRLNNEDYACDSGLKTTDIASSGVGTLIKPLSADKVNTFAFSLNINGSEQLNFIPVGQTNSVKLQSKWPSPSFNGAFLPASREVTDKGFSARWKVLHLNRNYPQFWSGGQYRVDTSAFGLKLVLTANIYQKATRIAKYAVMFILFTFSAFFFSEIINKRRVHPIQYLLIGLAILLFYTLLLSLSEYISFNYAYILSALAITLLITAYSQGIIRHRGFSCTILGILSILYAYLFVVLQLEDYALIMGSVGLLAVLATVMYITRHIDWYAVDTEQGEMENKLPQ
jgi:inner membrane protein